MAQVRSAASGGAGFKRRAAVGLLGAAAWVCLALGAAAQDSSEEGAKPANHFAKEDWKACSVEDLALDCPVELASTSKVAAPSEETRRSIEKMAVFASGEKSPRFRIVVTRTEYKPGFDLNLDVSVEGAIKSGAEALGDASPRVVLKEAKVPGMAARHAAYHGKVGDLPVHLHSLGVAEGRTVWAVQVVHFGDEGQNDAQRILDSVRIRRKK